MPLPLGITIQPRSRTRAASSQFRLAIILFKIHLLPSLRNSLRSFLGLPRYFVHFRPFHLNPCSVRYLLKRALLYSKLALYSLTMLRPTYDLLVHAVEKPLATQLYQLLLQKDGTLLVVSDGGAITDCGSFGWVHGMGTWH
jgi:hypothetical protein